MAAREKVADKNVATTELAAVLGISARRVQQLAQDGMLFQLDAKLGSSYTSTFSKAKSGPSELQKEIRSLQSVQADISAYTKQQAAVEKTQAKLDNLNKQYQLLQQEIKEASGPTTSLERESAKLEQRIGDTSNALAAQKEKLGATAKSLNEAGVGTDNLGSKSQDLADKLNTLRAKEEAAAESAEEYGDKGTSSIEAVSQAFAAAKVYEALEQIKDGACTRPACAVPIRCRPGRVLSTISP